MTKVAVITGASRGIGKAVAQQLATDGYQTVLIARNNDKLKAVASEISNSGNGIQPLCIALDVSDERLVKAAIEQVQQQFSRIDVLFNNAGVSQRGDSSVTSDEFKRHMDINVYGAFYFIHYIAPLMKQQRSGYIINVASRVALAASKLHFAYGASKAALRNMSASLLRELISYNIKVTTIFPSPTNTEMNKTPIATAEKIPVDDYAYCVHYLLSLSPNTCIEELYLQCRQVILEQEK